MNDLDRRVSPHRPERPWLHDSSASTARLIKAVGAIGMRGGGRNRSGQPSASAWNATSARRQRQARDETWSCGNQPAYHSMINRRSVTALTARACISKVNQTNRLWVHCDFQDY